MTKILIDEAAVRQAMEYLQDNQHLIADNERHAYVMEYNAFIERFEKDIADAALDVLLGKMAENARELGLSYEQPAQEEQAVCGWGLFDSHDDGKLFAHCSSREAADTYAHELSGGRARYEIHPLTIYTTPPAPAQEPVALSRDGMQKLLEQSGYDNACPGEMAAFLSGVRHRESVWAEPEEQPAPAQEPVIQDWMKPDALCDRSCLYACTEGFTKFPTCVPHTAPAPEPDELTIAYMSGLYEGKKRKPWVGSTDEERRHLRKCNQQHDALALAVEALLKEKNT
jgi:hypothetical protein